MSRCGTDNYAACERSSEMTPEKAERDTFNSGVWLVRCRLGCQEVANRANGVCTVLCM